MKKFSLRKLIKKAMKWLLYTGGAVLGILLLSGPHLQELTYYKIMVAAMVMINTGLVYVIYRDDKKNKYN